MNRMFSMGGMRQHGRGVILGLLISGLAPAPGLAQATARIRGVDANQIRTFLEQVRGETGAPGVSAAVAVDGEIVYSGGVGYAELDNRTPQSGKTVHNIGSVSKLNAVVALMRLVEQGKVDLDAAIQDYLPYMPVKEQPITVRHILTHTSGYRHYESGEWGPYHILEMRAYDDFEAATKMFRNDPLAFLPGQYWSYSSYATNLMHGIVETVSGLPFEEYLRRHVWEPAGMLSTMFDVPSRIVQNRGHGYVRNESGETVHPRYADVSYKYAGGGMISTVEDLVRLGVALNDATLLEPETIEEMYRPQLDSSIQAYAATGQHQPLPFYQGLIWRRGRNVQGLWFVFHGGSVRGTKTYLINFPTEGLVVAFQANFSPVDPGRYATALAQLVLAVR